MLRGTRTQYLRRQRYILFIAVLPATPIFLIPLVGSTGWLRIALEVVLPPIYVLYILMAVSRLTDKQSYRQQAKLQRKMNQRGADAVHLPGYPSTRATEKALAFAKRLFGGKSA